MKKQDIDYLIYSLTSFKSCAIQNAAISGGLSQNFQIRFDEIKQATDRSRLSPTVIDEYINFMKQQGCDAYSDQLSCIIVEVDLNKVLLTPNEAHNLSTSLTSFNC